MLKRLLYTLSFTALLVFVFSFVVAPKSYAINFEESCSITIEECEDLKEVYAPGNTKFAHSRVAGSLVGFANLTQGAVVNEPIPVNLAYWWNDGASRVPFAGKTLAADVSYSGPFLKVVLGVWRLTRNIAYGVISLVMLATGFMIITRKKIGPQAAVTVQMAIPRIIIALVLITFSYPIGAVGASMAFVMRGNVDDVVDGINWNEVTDNPMDTEIATLTCEGEVGLFEKVRLFVTNIDIRRTTLNHTTSLIHDAFLFMMTGRNSSELAACGAAFLAEDGADALNFSEASSGQLIAVLVALQQGLMGVGTMALLILIIIGVAAGIMWILVMIKVILIYLKILFSIIGAPIVFALGALPGNEDMTTNWFKGFAANVISIPAAWFIFGLSWAVTMRAILVAVAEGGRIGGGVLILLIVPFFFLYGANLARTIPGKIETWIVGEPKKRR